MTSKESTPQFHRPLKPLSTHDCPTLSILSIVQCILYKDSWVEAVHSIIYEYMSSIQ